MPLTHKQLEDHNQFQLEYYSRPDRKPNMMPVASPYLKRHLARLIEFGRIAPSDRLLEIGCGMGRYTLLLAEQGYRVEGLDLSPVLLSRLSEFDQGRFNIPLHCIDLIEQPADCHQAFDAIVGLFVLHHLHDLDASVKALRHYVRPGGRIVFIEPNPYCPLYYAQIAVTPAMTWQGEKGVANMTGRRLQSAIQRAGFINFKLERFGMLPPVLANKSYGPRLERLIECIPGIYPFLAFELIGAQAPK